MKKYSVSIPITGVIVVEVEAEDTASAIDDAFSRAMDFDEIDQWEPVQQIVRGNVFYGMQNEAHAEEMR